MLRSSAWLRAAMRCNVSGRVWGCSSVLEAPRAESKDLGGESSDAHRTPLRMDFADFVCCQDSEDCTEIEIKLCRLCARCNGCRRPIQTNQKRADRLVL